MNQKSSNNKYSVTTFGEFLLRLHCNDGKRFLQAPSYQSIYAGSEANVAVLLSRLGCVTNYITCIPDNDIAVAGVQQLKSHGVGTDNILYAGDKLGIFFTEPGNGIRPSRVIYDRAGSSFAALQPGMIDWNTILQESNCFHWSGIAAAVSQSAADVCAEALAAAKQNGLMISADFNHRSSLWKYGKQPAEVMPPLLQYADIAVADLDATSVYFGIDTNHDDSLEDRFISCSKQLLQKIPSLKALAMSFRNTKGAHPEYAGALMHDKNYFFSKRFSLPVITDAVGTGDAFTAGFIYGVINKNEPQHIINFATACGALKQSIPGDWAIINKEEVNQFIQTGASARIIR